jgi:hypothetical protein
MTYHEKLTARIAQRPGRAALYLGLLSVLVIILAVSTSRHRSQWLECKKKSEFLGLRWRMPRAAPAAACEKRDTFAPARGAGGEFDWTTPVCQAAWDPAAVAESQALADMGSLSVDHYGARRLRKAAAGEDSVTAGPSNSELIRLMRYGTPP